VRLYSAFSETEQVFFIMALEQAPTEPGRRIRQERSRKTYNALVATGFKLLQKRELEAITISELATQAGYSVGAFYSRFRSKDEFFDAMVARHLEERTAERNRIFATESNENLVYALVDNMVRYYWKRRLFWRAALVRSIRDPGFWEPIRRHGHEFADSFIGRVEQLTDQSLTQAELMNLRFAFQVALALINNTIINRPGPIFMGQSEFVENMARAFRLVSDCDRLMGLE
jgi:AcrR family transcriptional regulator